ncbi:MAG: ribose transport system substrate-binding protein [Miltoncostaeaceae bacterium]|jgi:ribose transport system substrate-binding protein|nr:ribose transport system substrate-binding protein [Miltoncostaeaceae bacterium]
MKILPSAVAAVSAILLSSAAVAAAPAPTRVGVILKGLDNPFFVAMFEGARAEASRVGARVTIRAATGIGDLAGQATRARALAAAGQACYVANPIDRTNLIDPLRGVGRPVVNVDSVIDPAAARRAGISIATYVGTDNAAAGALAARAMQALLPRGGDIALVGGLALDISSHQRLAGFVRHARRTNLRIAVRVAADFDRTKAQLAAQRVMWARPAVVGFFAANDEMALGISDAVRAAGGPGKVKIIGVDGIPEVLDAISSGSITATVSQYPYAMGQMAVRACVVAARGATLPAWVKAPIALVTRANVGRALATFPLPFRTYADPLTPLLGRR